MVNTGSQAQDSEILHSEPAQSVDNTDASGYGAADLLVLEGLEAVRKRPGMYVGSTDSRGLMHCLWEIIDNSVDEVLAGFGSMVAIRLREDGSVEVTDDGRGVPVDVEPRTGLSGVEVVYTRLHAGGKFGGSGYSASGGLHGVGASVVNALSSRCDVQVDRGGQTFEMSFCRGVPGIFAGDGPAALFTPLEENDQRLRVVGRTARGVSGTRVRYWADEQIFSSEAKFSYPDLVARIRQTCFLVPGLRMRIVDERLPLKEDASADTTDGSADAEESMPRFIEFCYAGGVAEFADFLSADTPVTDVWRLQGSGTFVEKVPVVGSGGGRLETKEVERECEVDVALRWGIGYDTTIRSFVNVIATSKGGTHQVGFESALLRVIRKQVALNARRLKTGNDTLEKVDVLAGLTAVVSVRLAEPQFEGQTKEVLGSGPVRQIVSRVVEKELSSIFAGKSRAVKAQTASLLEKVVSEMKSRVSARVFKEAQRRKNALESSSLPSKLADCRTTDLSRSELFVVEGDSALGTARLARSSDFQALLPIRGKILNVQKAGMGDVLANAECASLIKVVGAGSGRSFDVDAIRYGKIILMTDADVDGAHIRTLLLTLFFRYMRPLVAAGRVYAAVPPLHRVQVAGMGRRPGEVIYTYSEIQLEQVLAGLEAEGRSVKGTIQRYKGLGEMDADQLAETTMDPSRRLLRRVRVADVERAERIFDLLMGVDVAPRKNFIVSGAYSLDRDRIDA